MEHIKTIADGLFEKYRTRNPFKVIEGEGIRLCYNFEFADIKGFYAVINGSRNIVINGNLDDSLKKIVAAHELGHDLLHRELAGNSALYETALFDLCARPEYEANLFAADFLIPDEEVLKAAEEGLSSFEAAAELFSDVRLFSIKLKSMNNRGYKLNIGMDIESDFLR